MISLRISIISRDNDNDSFEFNRDFARTERILKTLEIPADIALRFRVLIDDVIVTEPTLSLFIQGI